VNVINNINNWSTHAAIDDPQARLKKLKELEQESITKLSEIERDLSMLNEKIKVLESTIE
jgi:hypothetical protein